MKFSKLLVLSALSLLGLSANAQYTERVAPEAPSSVVDEEGLAAMDKTPQEFKADEYYVLYNTGAMKYFIAGNDWNTRASFNDKQAAVVYFTQTAAAKDKGEGVYELKNFVPAKGTFMSAFADGAESIWTDNDGQANRFWKVTTVGENVRLSCLTQGDKLFLGNNPAKGDTRTYLLASGQIDWQLFAAPGWKEYMAAKEVYDKSEELRKAIDLAVELELDDNLIANAVGVYENPSSTIEEMEAQIQLIMVAKNGKVGEGATAGDPIDVTEDLLVNYSFDNNDNEGWSGDKPGFQQYGNAEFYNKNFDYYQTVKGARPGVYSLKVRAFFRPGSIDQAYRAFPVFGNLNAKLCAKTDGQEVHFPLANTFAGATDGDLGVGATVNINDEIFIANNMQAAEAFFDEEQNENAANYDRTIFFALGKGDMSVGLKKTAHMETDWTLFDNFSLTYYGNDADAFELIFASTKEAYQMPEDQYTVSVPYKQAFEAIVPASNEQAAIVEALNKLEAAYDSLTLNAMLWLDLDDVVSDAEGVAANQALDPEYTSALGEWAMQMKMVKANPMLTNAEIRALIAQKKEEIAEAKKHVNVPDTEVTDMLTNPAFDTNDWTGWTKEAAPGGNVAVSQKCCEAFNNASFDIYQVVKNAPVGVYKIKVQGFYRYLRGANAWSAWKAQESPYVKSSPCYVYMNDVQTPFMNIFGEAITDKTIFGSHTGFNTFEEFYAPDDMTTAADCFAANSEVNEGEKMFTQEAMGLVSEGQDLRIGVKGVSNQGGDSWVIFDNFKLIWVGYDADIIKPVLEEQIGIFQDKLASPMGKTAFEQLTNRITEAQEALGATGENAGKAMFIALSNLFKVDSLVTASISKFDELATANNHLLEAIGTYEQTAKQQAKKDAIGLQQEIAGLLPAHTLEDADVDAYIEKVEEAIAALRVPDGSGASDENAIDMTQAIANPDYTETDAGWKGTAANRNNDFGNAELFSKTYNYYQDLVNLDEGTYELNVQAFYRYGKAVMDYDSLNVAETSHAYLYAAVVPAEGQDTVYYATPLMRLAQGATDWTEDAPADKEGYAYCATDTTFTPTGEYIEGVEVVDTLVKYRYVANTMATASDEFLEEKYKDNSVIVKVPANGRMRIGLIKMAAINDDWTLFDNWKLTYFGNASAKEPSGQIDPEKLAVEELAAEPVAIRTELFTIDGRRASSMQKGIMIVKTTLSNGNIVVKKIRK